MSGTYTDIVEIVAPSSARAGETVPVTIKIKNLWTASVHVYANGVLDSEERFIDWLDYWIPAGATHSFSGSFIMPNRDVTIHAYSYFEAEDGYLYFDDRAEKAIALGEIPTTYHLSVHVPSWAAGGYIDPGSGDYPAHSTVILTAHPLSGYQFTGWGGDASGTDPTYNLYMDSDKYVEAYFELVPVPEPEFRGFEVTEYLTV